jgi:glucan-binding YG repeat protein
MAQELQIQEATEVVILTPEMEQQIKEANETLIQANLSSLPINKDQLAELQALKSLKIQGLADKGGYKLIDTERKRVKQLRLAIQRREKEILETPKEIINRVKAGVAEWVEELTEIEDYLQAEQANFEQLEREEKKRLQDLEDKKINDRCTRIDETGAVIKGQSYFIGEHAIHMNDVCDFKEDEFNRWIDQANIIAADMAKEKAKADLMSKRKSEINQLGMFYNEESGVFSRARFETTLTEEQLFLLSVEEFNALHSDLSDLHIAEKKKIEEFERKQQEQAEEQKRIDAAQVQIKRDRGNNRHLALTNLGFSLIGEGYYLDGTNQVFTKTEIFESEEDAWTLMLATAQAKSDEYNQEIELIRIESEEKEAKQKQFEDRCANLRALGFVERGEEIALLFVGDEKLGVKSLSMVVSFTEIREAGPEDFSQILAGCSAHASNVFDAKNRLVFEQKHQSEKLRAQELKKMRPDGEILKALVQNIDALKVDVSTMKSEAGKKGAERANHAIDLCKKELANITIDFV